MNLQTIASLGAAAFLGMSLTVSPTDTTSKTPTPEVVTYSAPLVNNENSIQVRELPPISMKSKDHVDLTSNQQLPDLLVAAPAKATGDCPCGPSCQCGPNCACRTVQSVEDCPLPVFVKPVPPAKVTTSVVVQTVPKTLLQKVCNGRTCQMVEVPNPNFQPARSTVPLIVPNNSVMTRYENYPVQQQMRQSNQYFERPRLFPRLFRWR